jgi:hypothetical protein
MALKRKEVVDVVYGAFGQLAFEDLVRYVEGKNLTLWCQDKRRGFERNSMYLALYKDIEGIGYNSLQAKVKSWHPMSSKTLRRNTKALRKVFKGWGRKRIKLGNKQAWDKAVRHHSFPNQLKRVNLWIDSEDLRLTGRYVVSRKDPSWSFKCNSPGRRYMMLSDGKGRVRKLWGGYTPKLYDGNFLELKKDCLERKLSGAEVVGDQHFDWGRAHLEGLKFHVPKKNLPKTLTKGKKRKRNTPEEKLQSKKQKKENSDIRAVRARVENRFGILQVKYQAFAKPWAEEEEQLDYLVCTAVGALNYSLG